MIITTAFAATAQGERVPTIGLAKLSKDGNFHIHHFNRHPVGDTGVLIDIMYAGICHSDIHTAKGEWGNISFRKYNSAHDDVD